MLHNRAARTAAACSASTAWSRTRRDARSHELAATCLAHGQGFWRPLQGLQTEAYLLRPDLRLNRQARHWWGVCDAQRTSNATFGNASHDTLHGTDDGTQLSDSALLPRPELLQEWQPDGEGCDALRKQEARLPELGALACAFCERYAGHTILFVGDSVQGELFLAFVSILGVARIRVNSGNDACRRVAPRGSGPMELDVSVEVCDGAAATMTVRFIRNELLWLDAERNAKKRHPDVRFGAPALMLCDWDQAAAAADMVVLNRGYHSLLDNDVEKQMGELNATLLALSATMRRPARSLSTRKRVVYRGTHGSFRDCAQQPNQLGDPLNLTWSLVAARMGSRRNSMYGWSRIEGRERQTKTLLAAMGVPYLDTFVSTSYRSSGGRMPNSCNHFCLPGPVR